MLLYNTYESMSIAAAHLFTIDYDRAIRDHGRFIVALSGGRTPGHFYELLASHAYSLNIDWTKVYFFFSDERYVPHDHKDSNYKLAKDNLLADIPVPEKNVFAVPTSSTPEKDSLKYERTIGRIFRGKKPSFDLLILGMGADGHTASLFPGNEVLKEKKRLVKEVFVHETNSFRISFTLPLINAAKEILILVSGKEKKPIIKKLLDKKRTKIEYPVQLVKGNVLWMVDEGLY